MARMEQMAEMGRATVSVGRMLAQLSLEETEAQLICASQEYTIDHLQCRSSEQSTISLTIRP